MAARTKVLLDTDIGNDIDDAVALAYLLSREDCELLGITTVSGEANLRAEMASAMCLHMGRSDIPIHAGADRPLFVGNLQPRAPQAAALGDRPRRKDFPPASAVEFLRRTIRENPGQVTLLAIGPQTNVAALAAADPEVLPLLRQLVLMSGQFFANGWAEWNVKCDPHAAAIVYGEGTHGVPPRHVSFGLDVTTRCVLPASDCRKRFTARALEPVRDFAEVWFHNREVVTFHDPLAAACIFEPEICRYKPGRVLVSTTPPTSGVTVFTEPPDARPHTVACDVDPNQFFEHYFSVVK